MKTTPDIEKLPDSIDPDLNLDQVKQECEELVKSRAKYSAGAAVVPVPFLDVAVDAGLLTQLLPEISERFGLISERQSAIDLQSKDVHWNEMKDRAVDFAGLMATRGIVKKTIQGFGGRIVAKQVTKFVPLGGQIVAASLGYMIFKKIAFDHIEQCYKLAKDIQQQQHGKTVNSAFNANTNEDTEDKSQSEKKSVDGGDANKSDSIVDGVVDKASEVLNKASEKVSTVISKASDKADDLLNKTSEKAADVADTASQKAEELAEKASDKTSDVADKASDVAEKAANKAADVADKAADKAEDVADKAADAADKASKKASDVADKAADAADNAAKKVDDFASKDADADGTDTKNANASSRDTTVTHKNTEKEVSVDAEEVAEQAADAIRKASYKKH